MVSFAARQKQLERQLANGARRGVVRYDPVGDQRRSQSAQRLAPQGDALDGLRMAAAQRQPSDSGGGGGLGTILNNPFAKAVGHGLSLVDAPRRVVISALQEGIDAFGDGDASFSDFFDQVGDESFGFGTVIGDATDNKWVNRGLGFLGDVALDPLTYLTFGANKFAGAPGRIAAATRLAEHTDDAAALARVGRLGVLGAKGAEREAIFQGMKGADKLSQPGLRLAGQRLPGTGRLAESLGGGLARTRANIGDRLPRGLQNVRTPVGLEDAARTIRSGQGNTREALQLISGQGTRRGSAGLFAARWANDADKLAGQSKKDGQTIFRMLDGEIPLEGELGVRAREFLDEVYEDAAATATGLPKRENFVPHMFTKEARAKLTDRPISVNGQTMDLTQGTGSALRRNIGPDSVVELPDGTRVKIETGFASEINEKLGSLLGVTKVVEDDFAKVIEPYVQGIAETVGRADMANRIGQIGTPGAGMVDKIDDAATAKATKKELREAERVLARAQKDAGRTGSQLDKAAGRVRSEAVRAAEGRVAALQDELRVLGGTLAKTNTVDRGLRKLPKGVARGFDDEVGTIEQRLAQLGEDRSAAFADEVAEREAIGAGRVDGKRRRDRERIAAKRAGETPPSGPIPERQAAREAADALERRTAQQATEFDARLDSIKGSLTDAERRAQKNVEQIDAARHATRQTMLDTVQRQSEAAAELAEARKLLARAKKAKPVGRKRTANSYDQLSEELEEVARQVGTYEGSETTRDLLAYYATGVARLTRKEESADSAARLAKALKTDGATPVLRTVVKDGFERIAEGILSEADAPIVRAELARMLKNFDTAIQDDSFWWVVDNYTKFFKTYATATPGFHVRNGMSATFMNATDGVSVMNMKRGVSLWRKFEKSPRDFYDNLPSGVSREQADEALEAVFASGGGQGQFGQAEIRLGESKLTNNPATRLSQRVGGKVEGWARMGMALDTILGGGTMEEAAARITRIHFDYSQVSKLDRVMKRLIPFWTFMSRNVPLQMQQMLLRPRMYQGYRSLVRNMGEDYEADLVPQHWQDAGAFKINDSMYLAPDLPHLRLEDELTKLTTNPQRLIADGNPILKVPLETLVAKRRFFQDRPFEENGLEAVDDELALLKPLLQALNRTETSGSGETVIDERLGYALRNLLPPLGQYQRLGSSDPYYEERRGQSVAGYAGVPLKMLTEGQQRNEARRRSYEQQDQEAALRALLEFGQR